jgi:hypothetical protein
MRPVPMGGPGRGRARRRPLPGDEPQRLAPLENDVDDRRRGDGELFAWEVTYFGMPVARWEYRLEPERDDVRLIEAVDDRRGRFLRAVSPLITGSPDRDRRNADTMESTLEAIKSAAEARTP